MLSIKNRQRNLKFLGYYSGRIDGVQGNETIRAIKEFQKAYGLIIDGIYGRVTDDKLVKIIKNIQKDLGVTADGIAGTKTIEAKKLESLSWKDIKYFKKEEFTCKCGCGLNNIDLKLVKILDELRTYFNKPIRVSSGCRCKSHNKAVGGVNNSRHILGKAADIVLVGGSKEDLFTKCKEYVAKGKARYTYTNSSNMKTAVHVDIR